MIVLMVATSGHPAPADPAPTPNSAEEPFAKAWSPTRSAEFLDGVAMAWMKKHHCAACHTHYPYLMASTALGDKPTEGLVRMRKFFEDRVANWDSDNPAAQPEAGSEGVTEVVATAATLAFHDAKTTGKLHPLTRKALDRMWTLQQANGAWDWNQHRLPPVEYDEYFGAVFAALGVGVAPEGYAQTDKARAGLANLRLYFKNNPAPVLHHKIWLMWASVKLEGLMTPAERDQTVKDVLALQRADGGWNLPSLGDWKRLNGKDNDRNAPSDGYATGLILYVLRQTGAPASDRAIQRGVAWLQMNQRASGRWFTASINANRNHYMTNAGTAFAMMALQACTLAPK
jgi:squalene-hopene/tetraprenyl-beta-curcumene cyclase